MTVKPKIDHEIRARLIHSLSIIGKTDIEIGKALGLGPKQIARERLRPEYRTIEEEARKEAQRLSERVFEVQEKIIVEVDAFCNDLRQGIDKVPDFDKRLRALNTLSKFCSLSITYEH